MRALYSLIFIGIYITVLDAIGTEVAVRGRGYSPSYPLLNWWAPIAIIGLLWMHIWPRWKSERTLAFASLGWLAAALLPYVILLYV